MIIKSSNHPKIVLLGESLWKGNSLFVRRVEPVEGLEAGKGSLDN